MATNQDSRQMSIEILSVNDIPQLHPQSQSTRRGLSSTETASDGTDSRGENTPLLGTSNSQKPSCYSKVKSKFKSRRCCLCSSKAALIILVWNMIVSFGLTAFLDPSLYIIAFSNNGNLIDWFIELVMGASYGASAFLLLFYPLAGCLADIRWGRHKTVVNSLYFTFWSFVSLTVLGGLLTIGLITIIYNPEADTKSHNLHITTITVICVLFGIPIFFGVILTLCSLIAFSANVIQYGMDQLHDAPSDDSVLYIHWYVWTIFLGLLIIRIPIVFIRDFGIVICSSLIPLAFIFLGIALCVYRCKRSVFLVDSGSRNPYKLVYKVSKFAKEHSNPIRRSAFTYCEDELPSRFDLGKEKYGGPFTTEQVENVKAFFGILRVLLSTGPILTTMIANDLSAYKLYSGFATPLIIVVSIPLYLGLLRPFIHNYIPGMLKRIGLGMILLLLSCLCSFAMSFFQSKNCSVYDNSTVTYCELFLYDQLNYSIYYISIQSILNAVGYMLFFIASYEFICAQSPHSMKGLLIGTFFAIKGVFQFIGVLAIYLPIARWSSETITSFPHNGGYIYYLINVVIALIGLIAFTITARRYQYRQRDEPDNIYRYAEEYYANSQDEPNYDYDDYDNLNCETINK